MYSTEYYLWAIVPFVNVGVLIGVLLNMLVRNDWRWTHRRQIALGFTGTSMFFSYWGVVVLWLDTEEKTRTWGVILDPVGPFATSTVVTGMIAATCLVILGLLKLGELFRGDESEPSKSDEKKE